MNATSYSDINTYQRCPMWYNYRVIQGLQSKVRSINLFKGINAHDFAKEFFLALRDGLSRKDAWEAVIAFGHEQLLGEPVFDDELADATEMAQEMLELVGRYVEQFDEEWEILHVEEEFIIMLDDGNVISFTPDLVVRDRNGFVWIIDHKTTSRMPSGELPFGDMQSLLYFAGVKALYPETKGFIFNRMRKKIPSIPRLAKTGKKRVAYLKTIDTTYEILRDFLQETAPDLISDPDHAQRLAELRDASERFFWTDTVLVNEATVDNILADVSMVLRNMQDASDLALTSIASPYPRNLQEDGGYKSCRKCPFAPLCRAEMLGWDSTQLRTDQYEPRDAKNPYEGEDDGED